MGHLTFYANPNPASRTTIPFLLDVQASLLSSLGTRVVVPLYISAPKGILPLSQLTPEVTIQDKRYIAMVPELAGIQMRRLGEPVGHLDAYQEVLGSALKLLISGF